MLPLEKIKAVSIEQAENEAGSARREAAKKT
jgi:hypothetical protein